MFNSIRKKRVAVLLSIFMIFGQLVGMTGCADKDPASESQDQIIDNENQDESIDNESHDQIIDNDLVVNVVCDNVSFKIGESWEDDSDLDTFTYPGTKIMYCLADCDYFLESGDVDYYFDYVIDKIREEDNVKEVLVIDEMEPYTTADDLDAFISRIRITTDSETIHDCDLLIFPDAGSYVRFDVIYGTDETVPLDIREIVDTATFDFGLDAEGNIFTVEGRSFYDKTSDRVVEFADSGSFFIYYDPDNRDTGYAYGSYTVTKGEEGYEKLLTNPEFGSTRDDAEFHIFMTLGQDFVSEFDDWNGAVMGWDELFTIELETEGYVTSNDDADSINFSTMYYGWYLGDYDVMLIFDGTMDHYYIWEVEEN